MASFKFPSLGGLARLRRERIGNAEGEFRIGKEAEDEEKAHYR
jgi:hypothetical protein